MCMYIICIYIYIYIMVILILILILLIYIYTYVLCYRSRSRKSARGAREPPRVDVAGLSAAGTCGTLSLLVLLAMIVPPKC